RLTFSFLIGIPLFLLFAVAGMLALLIARKHITVWGAVVYLLLLSGAGWIENIYILYTVFNRDYLPSSWSYTIIGFYETLAVLSVAILLVACGTAYVWQRMRGAKTNY
ncbi:hypothetical protein, partial [Chitinophaga sp.]|uniref:hypothetical protein n=1 Tax=Chitinophaga sp. TaxID=1869181 RepID=UPI0026144032